MEVKNQHSRSMPYLRIASFLVIAVALVVGGVLAGVRLTHAASSTPELYEVRQGGSIWAYTGGTSWQQIGSANSFQTDSLVGGSNALYQLHVDGSIWRYTGTPLTGWQQIAPATEYRSQFSASMDGKIYQTSNAGDEVFLGSGRYTGWQSLGTTSHGNFINAGPETIPTGVTCRSVAIGPNTKGVLYTAGSDGVWVFCETLWQQIDTNPNIVRVEGTPNGKIYQLRQDSTNGNSIWMYTGGLTWKRIDNAQNPQDIRVDGNSTLYQLAKDGTIWSYNGTSWTALPHNPSSSRVDNFKVSKSGDVFEELEGGSVWAYQAGAWQQIDDSEPYIITTDAGDWGFHSAS